MNPDVLMDENTQNLIIGGLAIVLCIGAFLMMLTTTFTSKK